jgi:hypothetical protein
MLWQFTSTHNLNSTNMALECFDNIIGISETTCTCLTAKLGTATIGSVPWYKVSKSGLFLDRLPGIIGITGVDANTPCDAELASFYQTAVKDAIKLMHDDLVTGLLKKFRQVKLAYSGKACSTDYAVTEVLSSSYAGVMVRTAAMKGGSLVLNTIYAMFDSTVASHTIKVYRALANSKNFEHIEDLIIGTQANALKPNLLASPKSFPLCEEGYDYYFIYDTTGINPKNNTISCGCGSGEAQLNEYARFYGITGNDLTQVTSFGQDGYAKGLAFDLSVGCDTSRVACDLFQRYQDFTIVMSHAVRFKAGEIVHELILNSDDINRFTMMNREYLWGKRNHFRSEYNDRIEWMIETADLNNYDCFTCNNNTKKVHKGGILA